MVEQIDELRYITKKQYDLITTNKKLLIFGLGAMALIASNSTYNVNVVLAKHSSSPYPLQSTNTSNSTKPLNMSDPLLYASGFVSSPGGSDTVNMVGFKVLDICTPFSEHTNGKVGNRQTGVNYGSCAALLGVLKSDCETSDRGLLGFCNDPRYTNWLLNDYHAYPTGTWGYIGSNGERVNP